MAMNTRIYVDHGTTADDTAWNTTVQPGYQVRHVNSADAAFRILPDVWHGSAEIIFTASPVEYTMNTNAVYFGTPIGPDASPLVIRGDYTDEYGIVTASVDPAPVPGDYVYSRTAIADDQAIGAVLKRLTGRGAGTAVSIRGNSGGRIFLQGTAMRPIAITAGETFAVQRPAVTLAPTHRKTTLTSHDGSLVNLKLIGIRIVPLAGANLILYNVRAQCDTCELLVRATTNPLIPTWVQANGGIQGGGDALRGQAGVYIHGDDPSNIASSILWVLNSGLSGHLTFKDITVGVARGGEFSPASLEALRAPIQILAGGRAIAALQGWGDGNNKARIRNVPRGTGVAGPTGDGLLVANGGSIASPNLPINLNIFGCDRDGIRVDNGSSASFGRPGDSTGLVTEGAANGKFGMHVCNASRVLVGSDLVSESGTALAGTDGQVAVDGNALGNGWEEVAHQRSTGPTGSLVRLSQDFTN
jgi:hypothetical protein